MAKKNQNVARKNNSTVEQHAIEAEAPSLRVNAPGDGARRVEPIVLSTQQEKAFKELTTTSAKIRFLHAEKFTRGQIALYLGKKYQHVRNVLITPLKKDDNTNTATNKA